MTQAITDARRHAAARYLGMPLFIAGAAGLVTALYAWLFLGAAGGGVMLYVGATGLSLGTFGTHSDTALAWMHRADQGALPPAMAAELRGELRRDREATLELSPTPRIAWGITAAALLLHAAAGSRLLGALGG